MEKLTKQQVENILKDWYKYLMDENDGLLNEEEIYLYTERYYGKHFRMGDKVHYIPFDGCDPKDYENGIVYSCVDHNHLFVVYHCNNEWENYRCYTAARTHESQLQKGWI